MNATLIHLAYAHKIIIFILEIFEQENAEYGFRQTDKDRREKIYEPGSFSGYSGAFILTLMRTKNTIIPDSHNIIIIFFTFHIFVCCNDIIIHKFCLFFPRRGSLMLFVCEQLL